MPIELDLTKLTQAHLDAALPNARECRYTAPCIIGALVPEDQREALDAYGTTGEVYGVESLVKDGVIRFPNVTQERAAMAMQSNFDFGLVDEVAQMARNWGEF